MNKNFVTFIVLVKEDYVLTVIRKCIEDIIDSNNSFVELFLVYSDESVNKFIKELNIDLPTTVVKNSENLPNFCSLGLGNRKFLINGDAIKEVTEDNHTQVFIGRRSNIVFK